MNELIEYLKFKIEHCEELGLPKEKWAFSQALKKALEIKKKL